MVESDILHDTFIYYSRLQHIFASTPALFQTEAITALRAENEAVKAENAELSQKVDWLIGQQCLSRQKRFGASSEKTGEDGLEQLNLLFNEAEVCAIQEKNEPVAVAAHVRNLKSGSVKDVLPETFRLRWWSTG